jgi:hypothetical protein
MGTTSICPFVGQNVHVLAVRGEVPCLRLLWGASGQVWRMWSREGRKGRGGNVAAERTTMSRPPLSLATVGRGEGERRLGDGLTPVCWLRCSVATATQEGGIGAAEGSSEGQAWA